MRDVHEAAGALFGSVAGIELPRHYGDPAGEYDAAVGAVGVLDRSHRGRLVVSGKAPIQMLTGVLTGRMPAVQVEGPGGASTGRAEYSAVLTQKGRMVTDLRAFHTGTPDEESVLLDVPAAGREALIGHLTKFVPPRLATTEDVTGSTGMLTLVGPGSTAIIAELGLVGAATADDLDGLAEDEAISAPGSDAVRVVRTQVVRVMAYDLFAEGDAVRTIWERAVEAGARPVGQGVWQTLRVEAGRPAFGQDMDETTIPYEAGIVERAVDHDKGCYTGQEVIVRIRDRGHVNRLLRGLLLGDLPTPAVGVELFQGDGGKTVGRITSAVSSPHFGEAIALAYVHGAVEPRTSVRVGVDGPTAEVRELTQREWAPRTL